MDAFDKACEEAGINPPPFLEPDEFTISGIAHQKSLSYDAAQSLINQLVEKGGAEQVGMRRSRNGGKAVMAYRLREVIFNRKNPTVMI